MSDTDTLVADESVLADIDSQDLSVKAEPLFEGTVPAVIKAIRQFVAKDESDVPTGRVSFIFSYALEQPLKEHLPEGGEAAREYPIGHRLDQWVDFKFAEGTSENKRRFAEQDRRDVGLAIGLKRGEQFGSAALRSAIGKPVLLKLSVSERQDGGYFQNIRVKAPAKVSSNGSH